MHEAGHLATFSDYLKSPEAKMIMRMTDVCSELGVSRASVYRLLESGGFPKPLKLGKRAIGWERDHIQQWVKSRSAAYQVKPAQGAYDE
jgi:prophage regulatory protein